MSAVLTWVVLLFLFVAFLEVFCKMCEKPGKRGPEKRGHHKARKECVLLASPQNHSKAPILSNKDTTQQEWFVSYWLPLKTIQRGYFEKRGHNNQNQGVSSWLPLESIHTRGPVFRETGHVSLVVWTQEDEAHASAQRALPHSGALGPDRMELHGPHSGHTFI